MKTKNTPKASRTLFRIQLLSMLFGLVISFDTFAGGGSQDAGSADSLGRLLAYAQTRLVELLPQLDRSRLFPSHPSLKGVYDKNHSKLVVELGSARFEAVSVDTKLTDSHFGYPTWIQLLHGPGINIRYNPNLSLYASMIDSQGHKLSSGSDSSKPHLVDIMGFLLHEVGHGYGLNEQDSWIFAIELVKGIDLISKISIPTKYCDFQYWNYAVTPNVLVNKSFELAGDIISKSVQFENGRIYVSQEMRDGKRPIIDVEISTQSDEDAYLSFDAMGPFHVARILKKNREIGLNLLCQLKKY